MTVIGDLPFRVRKAWMPRGLRGLQVAIVDVEPAAPRLDRILPTCEAERPLERFAQVMRLAAPQLVALLEDPTLGTNYTVFCPSSQVLERALGDLRDEEIAGRQDIEALLACHIVPNRVAMEALYNGRALTALDGTALIVTFGKWPKGDPQVNGVPIENSDMLCANGVIHTISGLLTPKQAPTGRRR
mmetsp:Transcript_57925/g.167937  ORF Transcript_57925/g.167937 Transcript_57925/m.167937 type:complete len:187 (-) Transcript_57925:192-752(-)